MRLVRENRFQLTVALGALLLIVGAVVAMRAPRSMTFGWFEYAPAAAVALSPDGSPGFQMVSTSLLVGLAVAAAGLLLLVATLAYGAGLRRGRGTWSGEPTQD